MIKFKNWELLNESLKTAKQTYLYSGDVTQEEFDMFKDIDPSKTFKYIDRLLYYYTSGHVNDISILKKEILNYHNLSERGLIKNKDINSLEYLEFKDEIMHAQTKMKSKDLIKTKESDTIIIKDNEKFLIVVPNTYEASCKYGQGTKWCTSSKDTPTHFYNYRYLNKVTLYYIYNKNLPETNPMYKTSVVVDHDGSIYECYNAKDELIDLNLILKMGLNRSTFKYIPPLLPDDILEAYEMIGNQISNKRKYVNVLKDITGLIDEDESVKYYIVSYNNYLDIAKSSPNNKTYHLIGWQSTLYDLALIWEILYSIMKDDIDKFAKIYMLPEELLTVLSI